MNEFPFYIMLYLSLTMCSFYTGSPSMHRKGNHFPSGSSFPSHSLHFLSGIDVSVFVCIIISTCVSLLKPLFSVAQTSTHVCLITDFCPGGELFALLDIQPMKFLSEESARYLVTQDPLVRSKYQCGVITK